MYSSNKLMSILIVIGSANQFCREILFLLKKSKIQYAFATLFNIVFVIFLACQFRPFVSNYVASEAFAYAYAKALLIGNSCFIVATIIYLGFFVSIQDVVNEAIPNKNVGEMLL